MTDNLNDLVEEEAGEEGTINSNVEASGDLGDFVDMTTANETNENAQENAETTEETVEEVVATPKPTFADRAEDMGLTVMSGGTYHYEDAFSRIAYKNIKTLADSDIVGDTQLPNIAVFTQSLEEDSEWGLQTILSDSYKFLGNATLIDQIKESILAVGQADLEERTFLTPNFCEMRHEIIVKNGNDIAEVGSIFPMMSIKNTYNGSGASLIVFGMTIVEENNASHSMSGERFGKIKQIHLNGSSSELTAAFGEYITIFNDNIQDVVTSNFANQVTPEEMLQLLGDIERRVGKTRKEAISADLTDEEGNALNMNKWQLFLALTRFTSVERNISSKKILESIVESVLVLPAEMINSLETING